MASLTLGVLAEAVPIANPTTQLLFQAGARLAGNLIDQTLFGSGDTSRHREGSRLESLLVQSSTYGTMIPLVYGNARIAGNVIWAEPMKEVGTTTTTSQSGGKGGGSSTATSSTTEYDYFATIAIAICEGEIDTVERVWADAEQLDLSLGTYRFYKGSETQLPDPYIESVEGVGSTPAYRGLSYVVIEDFPLADYGNRIPNFTFEVKRKVLAPEIQGVPVEEQLSAMILIPGSGEFVYDTVAQEKISGVEINGEWVQQGLREPINQHNPFGKTNGALALDQLEETCPNLEWVGLVVNWFGTSMDAGTCEIFPGVEYADGAAVTEPDTWGVGSFTRASAHEITYENNSPRYGGTPSDASLVRYVSELKSRGYKVMFLPMMLMDVDNKPWRGRLTGNTTTASSFFTKSNGYNAFITHYANLVGNSVDAFVIGSEMIGLTAINDGSAINRQFPAVDKFVDLSATIKGIVGSQVKVGYAADWSEYHHTIDGWYNLDPLWASPNIDFIGIDAYFPLTDEPQSELGYDMEVVKDGWTSGEGYDFYYTDSSRTTTASLGAAYAWKNIAWWWENTHTNPDTNTTAWVPQSKKIWFTEFGFPSVDGATNQPNVFYDPTSSESFFPYHSKGLVDIRAQRTGIAATLDEWAGSNMVEELFLWTWDARPFPYWPDLNDVWADGAVWKTGHWVQGKFGLSSLAAIVLDLCVKSGLPTNTVDVTRLQEQVDGLVLTNKASARKMIELLMQAYFFDAVEKNGVLTFIPKGQANVATIEHDDLLPMNAQNERLLMTRTQELELPAEVEVIHLNRLKNYQPSTQRSSRQVVDTQDVQTLNVPLVLSDQRAEAIAQTMLNHAWTSRTKYTFEVSMKYAHLEPADVIEVNVNGISHSMRLISIQQGRPGKLRMEAVAEDIANYDAVVADEEETTTLTQVTTALATSELRFLDMPALANDDASAATLRFAVTPLSSNWSGAVIYRTDDGGGSYQEVVRTTQAAAMGTTSSALPGGTCHVFDDVSELYVVMQGNGVLVSASELAVLNGANAALVGEEVIQFKHAEELSEGNYRLTGLLRGRLGTEYATASHVSGESFVLLDGALAKMEMPSGLIGLSRDYKAVSVGGTLGQTTAESFRYEARTLKPYAPVHIEGARASNDDWDISWVRRARVGGAWRDYADVPLSEERELYEIDILNGSVVVRTIESSSPSITYTAAQQVTDFGLQQSSLSLVIYQMSDFIGRGVGANITLN